MFVRLLVFVVVATLALAGAAVADDLPVECVGVTGTTDAPLQSGSVCSLLSIGISASPNPAPLGSTVTLYADCGAETDGWDNLGNSWWHAGTVYVTMQGPFTWTVYCNGNGVETQSITVSCSDCGGGGGGGGGGGTPPPPPSQTMPELEGSGFDWGAGDDQRELQGRTRCKWQNFQQTYHFIGGVDMLRYEGTFKVCYVPNKRIVGVQYMFGDAAWWCCGWWWRGNDQGYPTAEVHNDYVTMRWRGTIEFCAYPPICIGNKHVGVTITFHDNNTLERSWSVG